ncbi:MAG TPA: hemolysin family protein [Mobilitalea sp.]|nr:hemolysin family protein [Mobilitalea sp.]
MDDGSPISGIVIILILILLNAIITNAKAAFEHVNQNNIKKKAESGDRRSLLLLRILEKPGRYLNAVELILSFTGVFIGMTYSSHFLPRLEAAIVNSGIKTDIAIVRPVYYILFTILLVFITALFGTVIPRKLGIRHAQLLSYQAAGMIRFLSTIIFPLTWLMEKTMNAILRIFGMKHSQLIDNVTEEEIISMVNEGQEQGVFDAEEAEMISNIIELDEKETQDIMTPKKKIIAVNAEMTVEEALRFMLSESYTRYPLYEDNRDNIIGILHLKDIINAYISVDRKNKTLKEIARDPFFVPDTQNINILFHKMQSKNLHMAIVIDEYGQTAGLVAMEDFLEEIVGNIQDEYDEEEKLILAVEDDYVIVKGSIGLEELSEELDIIIDDKDFDTLNGLLISLLDRIPVDGEKATLEYQGYRFEILSAMNKMIDQVKITKIQINDIAENDIKL